MAVQALDAARLPIDWQKLALPAALIAVAYGLIPAWNVFAQLGYNPFYGRRIL